MDDCSDLINELKDIVRKWVPDEEAYAEQKITFLSQVNSSSVVTEGLKLLSMLIEIDSCLKHGCVFNRNKTVNQILKDHKIVGPTLPDVVPDGYRITGSTIILLETFVRTNQESFEQKYRHDFDKLLQLTKDLQKCGLMLVPVIDGRSNYYVDRFPDWIVERIRWLLLRLMNKIKESGEKIEELEYNRLICSLSSMENQNLGLESLRILKEEGLDYKTKLMGVIRDGVRGDLTTSECRVGIAKLYDQFCLLRESGVYQDVYKVTSREDLIGWLKCHKLNLAVSDGGAPIIDDRPCGFCQNHMLKVLAELIKTKRMPYQPCSAREEELSKHKRLLSDCNKIKGLKVLNTRRHTLLSLDIIVLNSVINSLKSGAETAELLVNNHFKSVNDRLLSVDLIINRLEKKLLKQPNWLNTVKNKLEKRLKVYDLDYTGVWLREVDYEFWYTYKFERSESAKCEKPTIRYKKVNNGKCYQTEYGSDQISSDDLFIEYLDALSTLSLGMVNSMKTSSAAKLVINNEKDFYGTVKCDECYFQDLDSSFKSILLYQKTGEKSRCYSLMHRDEEVTDVYRNGQSFYADPKRFFLPIMSSNVILEMSREMLSWLDWLTSEETNIIKSKLYTLIVNVLTVPSKRVQIYLQGFRYFIMAFVNEFHFEKLDKKLSVLPLTAAESHVFMLMDDIVICLLEEALEENMAKIFKFILNLSYLCHFITKETPDRLTDQIKCFEKFLEPKIHFNSTIVNLDPSSTLSKEMEDKFIEDVKRLLSKDLDVLDLDAPGISKEVLSLCASCFNSGMLPVSKTLHHDPQSPSFTSTALDMSSNKSVVVPKLNEVGEIVTQYQYQDLLSSVVVEMAQLFKDKLRFKLDRKSVQYAIYKRLTNMVLKRGPKLMDTDSEFPEDFEEHLDEDTQKLVSDIEANVLECLNGMSSTKSDSAGMNKAASANVPRISNLLDNIWPRELMGPILAETSLHEVKDFDPSVFPIETYKELCELVFNSVLKESFFLDDVLRFCPLDSLVRNLTTKHYHEEDYFECFKYILITAGFDNRVGRYDHRSRSRLGFKDAAYLIKEKSRISFRESNSEAISRRLDKSFFTNSSLRNLCFYSEESPTSQSTVSSSTGKLKFGLSYKEQVGSNRELYVGDLNTKLTTRLIEDYFESLASEAKFTCLNNDSEFGRALLDMKSVVRLSGLAVSLDHSKWGPYMSPVVFNTLFTNLDLGLRDGSLIDKSPIENLLNWHLHKLVEVPYNVIEAYLKSYTKRSLGLMDRSSNSICDDFVFNWFAKGEIPSHISSVLDMGQGILHNTSDYYGLLTEQFIMLCLELCFDVKMTAYTSSDDEIILSNSHSLRNDDSESLNTQKCKELLEFHYYLSSKLNKFVSPKTVAGSFASEFKSRFFIWSQEVPLLTKFVAAALHNIKAKSPHQVAETVDTILDQCVANGVSTKIIDEISKRTNRMINYSGHPTDPFLCVLGTDLKDWIDGSRGYRLQRSIEQIIGNDSHLSVVRGSCRQLFYQIRSGNIQEEFLIGALQSQPDDCLRQMLRICEVDDHVIEKLTETRWLNLRTFGDLRLVLRTKIMSGTRILDKEEVPSLIKSVQSKLSKNFVRGAKKIITDAINKSAFQSSICSGFIGLCKSMGSKCVRDGAGGFMYIKSLLRQVVNHSPCEICKPELGVFCKNSLINLPQFSRSLYWDYFSLVFTNACELGNWVFSRAEQPRRVPTIVNPNFFWCAKPGSHTELEDKINMNHVLYSIKRNFPDLFDEHISPFLSDLNSLKISWVQKIKFLDLCVAMDISSECLGIVSHMMRKKREEMYIVKQSELSVAHIRDSTPLEGGFQLNSVEVCQNFLYQLVFESMLHPVLLTTTQFKKYFWYGEVELLPNDADHDLGQLTQFVMDCKTLNISRCMTLDDLDVGYVHSTVALGDTFLNLSSFTHLLEWERRYEYQTFYDLVLQSGVDCLPIELNIIMSHSRKSFKFKYERKTTYHIKCKLLLYSSHLIINNSNQVDILDVEVADIDCFVSGSEGHHISLDGVGLIPLHPLFTGKELINLNDLLDAQSVEFVQTSKVFSKVRLDFKEHVKELRNKFSYKLQGPQQGVSTLHLFQGQIMERDTVISRLDVELTSKSVFLALEALDVTQRPLFLTSLHTYMKTRMSRSNPCFIHMTQGDLCLMIESYQSAFISILKSESDWVEFGDFALCFSNSLNCIMIADDAGQFRLKGRQCRSASTAPKPLDID